jgi:Sec-independent protein translocase protein TatA
MGQYTAWEIIVIVILVAVVLWAGRTPAFLRRRSRRDGSSESGRPGAP